MSTAKDIIDDEHRIGDVDISRSVSITETDWIWRRTTSKDIVDNKHGVGNIDAATAVGVATQTGSC